MGGFFRKIRFKKGNKSVVKEVTGLELGEMMEHGWKIGETLEVFDDGVDERAFHRARKKLQTRRKK